MILTFKTDFLVTLLSRLVTALITLLTVRFMTIYLPPDEYAQYTLLMSIQMFCGLFLINPVGQYINRHIHLWWKFGCLMQYFRYYNIYIISVSLIGAILALLLFFYKFQTVNFIVFLITFLLVYGLNWNATLVPGLNFLGYRVSSSVIAIVTGLVSIGCSILLMKISNTSIFWILGQSFGLLLGSLAAFFALKYNYVRSLKVATKIHEMDKDEFLSFCIPISIATILLWVQMSGYRFALDAFWSAEEFAFVVVGLTIAMQFSALFESFIQQYLYPKFYKSFSSSTLNESVSVLSDLINSAGPIYLVYLAGLFLGASCLTQFLVAESYIVSSKYMQYGVFIEGFRMLGNLLSNAAQITKNTRYLIYPNAVGSFILIVCFFILPFKQSSIDTACFILVLASFLNFVLNYYLMHKLLPFSLDLLRWVAGVLLFFSFFVFSFYIQMSLNLYTSLLFLLFTGLSCLFFMYCLLKNNLAFERLLAIDGRDKNIL